MTSKTSLNERLGEEDKKLVAWKHCLKCGTNYSAFQLVCYTCWRRVNKHPENPLNSEFANSLITQSGYSLPTNIVRLNVDYPISEELSKEVCNGLGRCFDCTTKSYCRLFGNPFFECKKEDWEYCTCKQCCTAIKKFARKK